MLQALKERQEIQDPRVLEEFKEHLVQWEKLVKEDVLELMELAECLENLVQRVTEVLTDFQVSLERKGIGVTEVLKAHLAHLVKMETGEKMERLDPEGCPVNLVNEDCWVQEVPLALQDNMVLLV